jgi:RHS repeat-associated protein
MKPPLRIKSVSTKVSEEEFAALESRARARKLTLSEWVRAELLEPRADGGGAADEVLLGEVLALRTILINLLFSLTNGKPVTPEGMKELIERAGKPGTDGTFTKDLHDKRGLGQWGNRGGGNSQIADIALVSANGTFIPMYNGQNYSGTIADGSAVASFEVASSSDATVDTHYYVGDHLGTAQMEMSSGGWPVWMGQFTPYGQELDAGTTTDKWKFTGKERDEESGLDYFGARYYGSGMGRFMSPDWAEKAEPIPYSKLDDPQSLNFYAYVHNNPVNSVDTDGHDVNPNDLPGGANAGDQEALAAYVRLVGGEEPGVQQGKATSQNRNAQALQQQSGAQTPGQAAANGPYGSNVIGVSGNTTTLPLYNGPNSSAEIIGTQVVTNNLNSHGSGTIKIVNTNQDIAGSSTETITMRLRNGLTQSTSVRSSDGSVNIDSSTSFSSRTGQATVTTNNHNTSTINIRVYDTAGGTGPILRSNTTYDTTWVH